MVERCILGMGNSFLRSRTQLLGVALGNVDHQPGVGLADPLAIQGEIWQDTENLQSPIQVLRGWLQD